MRRKHFFITFCVCKYGTCYAQDKNHDYTSFVIILTWLTSIISKWRKHLKFSALFFLLATRRESKVKIIQRECDKSLLLWNADEISRVVYVSVRSPIMKIARKLINFLTVTRRCFANSQAYYISVFHRPRGASSNNKCVFADVSLRVQQQLRLSRPLLSG